MDSAAGDLKERLNAVESYLQQTPFEEQFKQLCTELLAENELPYNPYHWLINRFQIIAQRYFCWYCLLIAGLLSKMSL